MQVERDPCFQSGNIIGSVGARCLYMEHALDFKTHLW